MSNAKNLWHPPLDRAALEPYLGECIHPARSMGQADLIVLTGEASGWVLKDFSRRPLWMRLLVNRRALRREARAIAALQGLEGVPRLAGMVGPDAMLIEFFEAERLPRRFESTPSAEFFDRLKAQVAHMHKLGWAHGDLRRKNILIDENEKPYLIDFATAWHAQADSSAARRWLFRRWVRVDRITMTRIKQTYRPESLKRRERRLLAREPWYLRVGRFFKKKVYRPLKPRHRRARWQRIQAFFKR